MIRLAKDEDHPQLKALWRKAFGDSAESLEYYFKNRHRNRYMLVDADGDQITGMLTMLPVRLAFGGEVRNGRYIYAVATASGYRGQGISSRLLQECHSRMKDNGETAAVLVPSSVSLFSFYEKRGYETVFFIDSITYNSSELPSLPQDAVCTPCTLPDLSRLRENAFSGSSLFVKWSDEALAYVSSAAWAWGDGIYHFRTKSGEGYAVCGWMGRKIIVRELALIQMEIPEAVSILHHTLGAEKYLLRLPAGSLQESVPQPFGMIHYLEDPPAQQGRPPYLSLVLD